VLLHIAAAELVCKENRCGGAYPTVTGTDTISWLVWPTVIGTRPRRFGSVIRSKFSVVHLKVRVKSKGGGEMLVFSNKELMRRRSAH
jgi:hypothetical protein